MIFEPPLSNPAIDELGKTPQWVCWGPTTRNGKVTKPPISPKTGKHASSTDPNTWTSIDDAIKEGVNPKNTRDGLKGVGFVFQMHDPYVGIDLDKCIADDGAIAPWAQEIIDSTKSYTETSPSGKGLHIITKGKWGRGSRKGGLEVYDRERYFTMTGQHLEGTPETINDRQAELDALRKEYFGEGKKSNHKKADDSEINFDTSFPEDKFNALLANHKLFKQTWEHKRKIGEGPGELADDSNSTYDWSLTCISANVGWIDNEIVSLIIAHRKKYGGEEKARRTDYMARLLAQAQKVRDDRAEKEFTSRTECYENRSDGIFWLKPTKDGEIPIPLTNFLARIKSQIEKDDGAEVIRQFEMEAKLHGRTYLFPVSANEYSNLSWVVRELGAQAIVYPGISAKEHTRVAIQLFSSDVECKKVFAHFGWRKYDGEWVYLHAQGGIGKNGVVDGINVDPNNDKLNDYILPNPPTGDDLITAIRASLSIITLAPEKITFSSFATIYRGPLGEIVSIDNSIFYVGPTGAGKSVITALLQAHYGDKFNFENLPGSWAGTANSLEKQAFLVKDGILTIDDFAPAGSQYDVSRLHKEADRLLRAQGNRSGRSRMRADGTLRAEYYPRGIIVSSGEDIPKGQSVRARALILEISPGNIDFSKLTKIQRMAADGLFAQSMAGYIKWLAPQMDDLKESLPKRRLELRDMARQSDFAHNRTPDIVASLMVGFEMFLKYAWDSKAIDDCESEDLRIRAWRAIGEAAQSQASHQVGEEPASRFIDLLSAALTTGNAHVVHWDDISRPNEDPGCWGWRGYLTGDGNGAGVDDLEINWKPLGGKVGWLEDDDLYLDPEAAFAVVQKMARDQGVSLSLTQQTLWKRLDEKKLLASKEGERRRVTVRRTLGGKRRRVLHLKMDILSVASDEKAKPKTDQNTEKKERWPTYMAHTQEKKSYVGQENGQQPKQNQGQGSHGPHGPSFEPYKTNSSKNDKSEVIEEIRL